MFGITGRSKPNLKELIPKNFVDIHSHILPGIDDGPKNINESIDLIKKMNELGFSKIIGTPHTYPGLYENTNESIKKSFNSLQDKLEPSLKIEFASEYIIEEGLIEKAKNKSLLTIKENYVLIEMSFVSAPLNLYEVIFHLKLYGYIPVLAHPERYIFYHNNFDEYIKLKDFGCKFQLNLLSSTGYYGKDILKISDKLLDRNLINFVGSDIHSEKHLEHFNHKVLSKKINKLKKSIEANTLFI